VTEAQSYVKVSPDPGMPQEQRSWLLLFSFGEELGEGRRSERKGGVKKGEAVSSCCFRCGKMPSGVSSSSRNVGLFIRSVT